MGYRRVPALIMLNFSTVVRRFTTQAQCLEFLFTRLHPHPTCPHCARQNQYHRHPHKPCYTCTCGRHHIYPCVGTVFQGSKVSLVAWFWAFALLCDYEGNFPAYVIQRLCDVSYPTACRIRHRWRETVLLYSDDEIGDFELMIGTKL